MEGFRKEKNTGRGREEGGDGEDELEGEEEGKEEHNSDSDAMRKEGNKISHPGRGRKQRHCFIGGEMRNVCVC